MEKLVRYLVEDPPQEADPKRQFKYPFAACEIFCCEVEGVYNTLLESDDLLDRLFGLLHGGRPLNSMLAGYFARVVGSLLLRRSADVMQFLQTRTELLPALVYHVDTTSVAEVLVRLVGADDPRSYPSAATLQWLVETDLLKLLVDALGAGTPAEGQANAAEVLAAVARSTTSPLTRSMASTQFMQQLVDAALAPHDSHAGTHALNVCIALLEPPPPPDPTLGPHAMGVQNGVAEIHEQLRAEAIRCVAGAAERLVALLADAPSGGLELRTSYGLVRVPVGQLRLKAVDLIAALLRTGNSEAESAIMRTRAIQRTMDLFLAHPFNNALHGGVAALLTAFEPGTDALREFLLKEARLVEWLINAPESVTPEPIPGDPRASKRSPLRAGYCGHITQISNRLFHISDISPAVRHFLMKHEGWQAYIRERLEPRNKLESVFSWACGRPAAAGHDLGGAGELYPGEMGFATLEAGTFTREVYQRYGAYDDDEDEDKGAPPEWIMELPGAGEPGKLAPPTVTFEAFQGHVMDFRGDDGSSEDDSDEELPIPERGLYMPPKLDVASHQSGAGKESMDVNRRGVVAMLRNPDTMADMQDDAVIVEDAEAAEGLVELRSGLGSLALERTSPGKGGGPSEPAKGEETETGPEYNSSNFWRPTFAVPIEESE